MAVFILVDDFFDSHFKIRLEKVFFIAQPSSPQASPIEPVCFTEAEVERILHQPNLQRFTGLRDYTMMLLLLNTGIRLTELSALLISDLDFQDSYIYISRGKGNKSRFVPIQKTCAAALHLQLRGKQQHHALWMSGKEQPLQQETIKQLIIKKTLPQRRCFLIRFFSTGFRNAISVSN